MLELMGAEKGHIKVVGGDKSLQALNHPVNDMDKLKVLALGRGRAEESLFHVDRRT